MPNPAAAAASLTAAVAGAVAGTKLIRRRQARRAHGGNSRSYHLHPDERTADGIRRIARGQIDLASERLESGGEEELDEAIHEARKAFKRLRAVLRLVRHELGDDVYRRENETFRQAGRDLSGARDARVMADTLAALVTRHAEELPPGAFEGLGQTLRAEADASRAGGGGDRDALRRLLGTLRAARIRVATWPLREDGGLEMLAPGLERTYKRGRRAARAAREDPCTEALHDLRKRSKDLWHAAQVLRPAAPDSMRELARDAHDLSDVLGEDHDLAVLLEGAKRRAGKLKPGELELLTALVDRGQARLRREGLERAERVFRRKPRKLAAMVAHATA